MLLQRTLTALVLAPLVILLILLSSTGFLALVSAAAFLAALREWMQLSGLRHSGWSNAWLFVAAGGFALLWWAHTSAWISLVLVIGVAWWLVACAWLRHFAFAAAPTSENRVLKLLAGAFVVFPAWIAIISIHDRAIHGSLWTLLALLLVWVADIGAYFSGRAFGRRKLAPQISPGKTRAGAYGAVVAGVAVAMAGGWLLDVRGSRLLALALLAAITVGASIVGDLLESLMKRHAGVKDSGTLIPGHGGLMDRLDSVFAALPVFAAGLLLLDLVP